MSLADTLPAGVTFVPGSASGDLNGASVVVGVPPNLVSGLTMPRGSLLTVTFRVTVDDPLPPGTTPVGQHRLHVERPDPGAHHRRRHHRGGPGAPARRDQDPGRRPPSRSPAGRSPSRVTVGNPSAVAVTLVALMDDVFGDLRDAGNPAVSNNTCPAPAGGHPGGRDPLLLLRRLPGRRRRRPGPHRHRDGRRCRTGTGGPARAAARPPSPSPTCSLHLRCEVPGVGSVPEPGGTVTFPWPWRTCRWRRSR